MFNEAYDLKADLNICMQTLNSEKFRELLNLARIDLYKLTDHLGFNIFHDIASCIIKEEKLAEYLEILKKAFVERYPDDWQTMILPMLNSQAVHDRNSPLHCAILNNRKKIIEEFIKLGSNFRLKNVHGQNVMHLSVIAGNIQLLAYFKYKHGMPINELDNDGKSLLHLAISNNNEYILSLLLTWIDDLEIKDKEGRTPLHAAVLSREYYLVRSLLVAGAKRKARDNSGVTPLDLAIQNGAFELIRMLKEPLVICKLNPCQSPLKPMEKTFSAYILYIFIFVSRYGLVFYFMLPHYPVHVIIISCIIFIMSFLSFFLVSCMNPGYLYQKPDQDLLTLYEKIHPEFLCPKCIVKRTRTTKHCQHCGRCVDRYDHHCPWIRNCVGRKNYRVFIWFITICLIDFTYHIVISLLEFFKVFHSEFKSFESNSEFHSAATLMICIINFICMLFIIPVVYIQYTNILRKTTTHERFAYHKENRSTFISIDITNMPSASETTERASIAMKEANEFENFQKMRKDSKISCWKRFKKRKSSNLSLSTVIEKSLINDM
ncbi:unnamed protein product [Blepharisma stoltei]|uniref:Palmitoyltransferase n=1 Tax=Blepharisma stoltei TaxID=1481888 RepID=A0AAU9KC50_9CILI|nr:unnamed protein product [Blepharisma stoltei]